MKKGLLITAMIVIAIGLYLIFFYGKKDTPAATTKKQKPVPLSISKNPEAFNTAFSEMLNTYYTVKDDLVNWDSTKAASDALLLKKLSEAVPFNTMKADKNILLTAQNYSGAIAAESETLNKAATIEAKRRSFNTISDDLYSLINAVRYDREVIYHDMCPMAFNESEQAYWLSRDSVISNPYLGNKHPKYKGSMVTCGEVEDSVKFAGN